MSGYPKVAEPSRALIQQRECIEPVPGRCRLPGPTGQKLLPLPVV